MSLIALVTSISLALAAGGQVLRVKVPFDFRAGATRFGPGEYVLALDRIADGSVTIQSADRKRGTVVQTRKSTVSGVETMPTVSFRAYGDDRFLAAIQAGGAAGERWELAPSADEAALTRAKGQPKVTVLKVELLEQK